MAIPQALQILSTDTRLDGRATKATRDFVLSFPAGRGVVFLEHGQTHVLASAQLSVVHSTSWRTGRLSVRCVLPQDLLETIEHANLDSIMANAFARDAIVPRETLSIIPRCLHFAITCVVDVLSDDGGLRDACIVAAGVAIYHMGLPNVTDCRSLDGVDLQELSQQILKRPRTEYVTMRFLPLSVTFGHVRKEEYEGGYIPPEKLVDCTHEELECCESCTTIILDKAGMATGVYRYIGMSTSTIGFVDLMIEAAEAMGGIAEALERAVNEDVVRRREEAIEQVKQGSYAT
ncbi:putative Exosome complex exonuclease [Giardia muris]|uniref:Putative Exosome complex exonuclease n=1 Tax=Giardia muris TaxID=5742 RepID=A0A4Z1TDX0_GIAMU|nr:putative Exosome complex exonuclease [Giardia muris]|eukprot:TNJ30741.1 putative Exosome complex exonuclease [Giardia muris]